MRLSRRSLLRGAAAASLGVPRLGRAAPSAGQRKFLFVFCDGGWDVNTCWIPPWELDTGATEEGAELSSGSVHSWVSHPDRPAVDRFHQAYEHELVRIDGIQIPSIAHEVCAALLLTGGTDISAPDVATILAAAEGVERTLPHLVTGGSSYPGAYGHLVARTGVAGELQALTDGSIRDWGEATPPQVLSSSARDIVDAYLLDKGAAELAAASERRRVEVRQAWLDSLERSIDLRLDPLPSESSGVGMAASAELAVELLASGHSRCASLFFPTTQLFETSFDTHVRNQPSQSVLFEALFSRLEDVMALMEATPGEVAGTLAEETVVVVWSEMGRTPYLNEDDGKDHWPFSSVMVRCPGYAGVPVIGGYDAQLRGAEIDHASGEASDDGRPLQPKDLLATLLALGDVDHQDWLDDATLIEAML